ncbi:MAG TPA: DUF5915 domain-containing protein, partial [Gemmatimonadaceae bacterium]|nr:DUF5915 domain-containing protein [Gemmatimonadaceae bacterium]
VVSLVQGMRRDAKFHVSDRIRMWLTGTEEVTAAVREHRDWIAGEVLARDVVTGDVPGASYDAVGEFDLDGSTVRIALTREA